MFKRIGISVIVLAVVIGCNTNLVPNGATTNLDDNGFTDADASPGGTGGTGGPPPDPGTDDVDLPSEETRSFFAAFQIDPVAEDTAGPKFVVAGDVDQDGLTDLVSAWNQSQPIQLHLQRRDPDDNISFRTINLGGTTPIAVVAGLELGQINDDGWLDVVVLVKASGAFTGCPGCNAVESGKLDGQIIVLFNPGAAATIPDGDRWSEMVLVNPFVAEKVSNYSHNQFPGNETVDYETSKTEPENSGFTALAVANIDGFPGDEIIVALNPSACGKLDQQPPTNTVDLWINPGPGLAETSANWGAPPVENLSRGIPIAILRARPEIKDIAVSDVEGDGDLDVVVTLSDAITSNIVWVRNPLVPHSTGGPGGAAEVESGFTDLHFICLGGKNDGGPCDPNNPDGEDADCPPSADFEQCASTFGECEEVSFRFVADGWQGRPVGQVDTGADVIAIGDVDTDGFDDILVRSTNGQIIQWFRRPNSLTIEPEFPPSDPVPDRFNFPWPVFTLTEFDGQTPQAIAIGDVTNDGQNEVMIAVEGGVFWYDGTINATVYDPWVANTIIQDTASDGGDGTTVGGVTPGAGVGVQAVDTSTNINALLIVDLDGDGRNDIIGTLDRRSGAGLSDDRLVWYRNTREETD